MEKMSIYLCAHPEDAALYAQTVKAQLCENLDCQVFTDADLEQDRFIHYWRLRDMRLFVMPVTKRLLTEKSEAMRKFRFAREHCIPVIPWLMEEDLEELFADKCADIPFLRKEESVDTFLKEFRMDSETVRKIREAFDATVFISAHEQDGRFIRQAKSLIHDCWGCGNLGFSSQPQPQPGQVFVLLLTHNTLHDGSGRIRDHYRRAQQLGLPMLAVEMVSGDRDEIQRQFPGITQILEGYEESDLTGGILDALDQLDISVCREKTPEQIYYIGLAFLYGIDVELQRQLGARMIEYAARSGLQPAKEKLSVLQKLGDGLYL